MEPPASAIIALTPVLSTNGIIPTTVDCVSTLLRRIDQLRQQCQIRWRSPSSAVVTKPIVNRSRGHQARQWFEYRRAA